MRFFSKLITLGLLLAQPAQSLSIPNSGFSRDAAATRKASIDAFKNQIVNVHCMLPINGVLYPLYNGSDATTSSLTRQIQRGEYSTIIAHIATSAPNALAGLLMQMLPNISKAKDYAAYYEAAYKIMIKPMAMDMSDENFGMQRVTIKGFNLKLVCSTLDEYQPKDDKLTDTNVRKICGYGVTLKNTRKRKQLFVQYFSDYAVERPRASEQQVRSARCWLLLLQQAAAKAAPTGHIDDLAQQQRCQGVAWRLPIEDAATGCSRPYLLPLWMSNAHRL